MTTQDDASFLNIGVNKLKRKPLKYSVKTFSQTAVIFLPKNLPFPSNISFKEDAKFSQRQRTKAVIVKPMTSSRPSSCLWGSKLVLLTLGVPQGCVPAAYLQWVSNVRHNMRYR